MAPAPALRPAQRDAIRRWKQGHHAFHVVLIAMNTRLDEVAGHLDAEDWHEAAAALLDLTRLCDAATSIMRYTGGFRRVEYETLIRPSMMPPLVSPGFSGVFNREHAVMTAGLVKLRTRMRSTPAGGPRMPETVRAGWERFLAAQRANRRAHMLICRRFVDEGMSLLGEFYRRADSRE